MKKKINQFLTFLGLFTLGFVLGLVIYRIFICNRVIVDPVTNWITDTIYVNVPYPVPIPYKDTIPPIIITEYKVDSAKIDSLEIVIDHQGIIIRNLEDSILLSNNFLKAYPSNPKLIQAFLQKDKFSLSLLNTSGTIQKYDWPIFLDQQKYTWVDFGLTSMPNKIPTVKVKPLIKTYAGMGYNFWQKTPHIFLSANQQRGKLNFELKSQLGLFNINNSNLTFEIGYQIKNPL